MELQNTREVKVKMRVKAFALSVAGMWAACVLVVGLAHLFWPGYGGAFLDLVASIYPGFHPDDGLQGVMVGTIYAIVDGGIGGALLAWLYNRIS